MEAILPPRLVQHQRRCIGQIQAATSLDHGHEEALVFWYRGKHIGRQPPRFRAEQEYVSLLKLRRRITRGTFSGQRIELAGSNNFDPLFQRRMDVHIRPFMVIQTGSP